MREKTVRITACITVPVSVTIDVAPTEVSEDGEVYEFEVKRIVRTGVSEVGREEVDQIIGTDDALYDDILRQLNAARGGEW